MISVTAVRSTELLPLRVRLRDVGRLTKRPSDEIGRQIHLTHQQICPKHRSHPLVHAARVTKSMRGQEYYGPDSPYRKRDDCIYEWDGNDYRCRRNPFHDERDMPRDLGLAPERRTAQVLLSEGIGNFRYFGKAHFEIKWGTYMTLRDVLDSLRQGHRVHHVPEVRSELEALVVEVFQEPFRAHAPHLLPSRCEPDDEDEEVLC